MRRTTYFENLTQDAAYGLRMVAKWRGISAVLAITLALGIGVNTAIFSVLNGWLLRPLPVPSSGANHRCGLSTQGNIGFKVLLS